VDTVEQNLGLTIRYIEYTGCNTLYIVANCLQYIILVCFSAHVEIWSKKHHGKIDPVKAVRFLKSEPSSSQNLIETLRSLSVSNRSNQQFPTGSGRTFEQKSIQHKYVFQIVFSSSEMFCLTCSVVNLV